MRMLMKVTLPHQTFNAAIRDGTAGGKMQAILDDLQPESVYFTEMGGHRTAILIVELENPSKVPSLAEPWFLTFDADVELHVVMDPAELQQAGLDELGAKWST